MKSKSQKIEELSTLKTKMAKAKIVVITSFAREGEKGLTVSDMKTLKTGLRATESEYLVEKKTLLDKAIKNSKKQWNVFENQGSLGAALGYGDEQLAAKAVYNFAKKNPAFKYFGAIMGDKIMDFASFTEFAKLPTKDVMIARMLGMMKYPISALAIVLNQISNNKQTA